MNGTRPVLYTVGHSDHAMPEFLELLARHDVDVIADVRSQPYSKFTSQFNRETLSELLKRSGIQYVFLGRELGARRIEPESYRNGQARYELISQLPAFREGLGRVRRGMAAHRVALMCAEKDPITCHRTILICRQLRGDCAIQHILEDGRIETTEQAESRLLEAVGLPPGDLFQSRTELVEQAYGVQGERIAYTESDVPQLLAGGSA